MLQSPTDLANAIPCVFMDDTDADRAAIQPLINQVMVYPLTDYTPGEMRTKDWSDVPSFDAGPRSADAGETKWVVPGTFFDRFAEVLTTIDPLPGEEALYAQFSALVEAGQRNPAIAQQMLDAVIDADATFVAQAMRWEYNGKPAGNGWNRSQHNSEWELDYENRAATSKSNMFENRPNETQYFYSDVDGDGSPLRGDNRYEITFPAGQLPPVDGFWSLTMYNETHFFHPNDLHRFSLGTKNKSLTCDDDGSLTLYVSHDAPGTDVESNWLPAPRGVFSLYLHAYGGQAAITDGTWIPPLIRRR